MDFKDLKKFGAESSKRISENNLEGYDTEKQILHATVKANEEMGELCDAVLKHIGSQRRIKLQDYDSKAIGYEASDVIITLSIMMHLLGVDLEKALKEKMSIIESRYDENGKEF